MSCFDRPSKLRETRALLSLSSAVCGVRHVTSLVRSLHPIRAIRFDDGLRVKAITVRCNLACNALHKSWSAAGQIAVTFLRFVEPNEASLARVSPSQVLHFAVQFLARGHLVRTMRWVEIASIASVAWAIAGSNAGMLLAVAPATTTYRVCLDTHGADSSECKVILRRDW